MRLFNTVAILLGIVTLAKAAPDPCSLDVAESSCDQTEYEAYKECIHNEAKNEVRNKRQAPCPLSNLESLVQIKENCQRANFDCRIACGEDEACQNQCPVCPVNVDELIATANDTGDHRTIVVEAGNNVDKFHTINAAGNITTVIRLTNIINATTSDDPSYVEGGYNAPISSETGGEFGLGSTEKGPCCFVVHPKTCSSTSTGLRCHHRREKVCGKQCTAKVIHAQVRKRCDKSGCHKKVAYVPQPKRPKCVHTRKWPHVSCGSSYTSSCDGCYDHYGYGSREYDKNEENDKDCEGCYDDAFDYGPYYRRGPVLRPYFYHAPPCYIMGTCYPYPFDCGYGCFDHELVDPAWGYHHHGHGHGRDYDEEEFDFDDTENDSQNNNGTNAEEANGNADDWAIQVHKCKVVSDNGTIEIRNCTSEDIDENPYAAAPSGIPYHSQEEDYDGEEDDFIRSRRHIKHRRFHPPPVMFYRLPIIDSYEDVEDDGEDYSLEPVSRRHKSRQKESKKPKNPIVYDDDDDEEEIK